MSMLKSTHITSMNLKHQEDNNLRVFEKRFNDEMQNPTTEDF